MSSLDDGLATFSKNEGILSLYFKSLHNLGILLLLLTFVFYLHGCVCICTEILGEVGHVHHTKRLDEKANFLCISM